MEKPPIKASSKSKESMVEEWRSGLATVRCPWLLLYIGMRRVVLGVRLVSGVNGRMYHAIESFDMMSANIVAILKVVTLPLQSSGPNPYF